MRIDALCKKKFVDKMAVVATILGIMKVLGAISGVWIFTYLAQTLAISPAPSPYSHIRRGFGSDYSVDLAFGCVEQAGPITWHRWDYTVRGAVPGPHRYNTSIFEFFGLLRRERNEYDEARVRHLAEYYFCRNGMLAQAANCAPDLSAVLLMNHEPNSGREIANMRVACSP